MNGRLFQAQLPRILLKESEQVPGIAYSAGQDVQSRQAAREINPLTQPTTLCPHPTANRPLTFVVCSSDETILKSNLMSSLCLAGDSIHEIIVVRNAPSAAAGLNLGLQRSRHDRVVCVHQDVYLPRGWDRLMLNQYRMAERRFGPIGVAGVYGVGEVQSSATSATFSAAVERIGWVNDRGRILSEGPGLPARVATLDELLLIVRHNTPLRFDPGLGFHLYGADLCLQARERGLATVSLGAAMPIITREASDYPRPSSPVPGSSLASGRTACPWPRRASSSTATGGFTCWATRTTEPDRSHGRPNCTNEPEAQASE